MKYHLFEVFGIELEYMFIDASSFKVNPIVDQLFISKNGEITSDIENGEIEWSNELVAHVVELKTNGPTGDLDSLDLLFAKNIKEVNSLLKEKNTRLLPSAAHPLMKPATETELWKHSSSKIYALYNRIFDCSGHGWSNVQSMHINLPFFDDAEFEKLHAAVRLLLPIIPALSASSPILEGKDTGFKDTRMQVYKTNQKEIPEMTGKVIPEQVFSKDDYYKTIFEPINNKIKPHDTENILDHHFLNSRGAIARFDRNAIEIRVIDVQECPKADMAIAIFIIECLKLLVSEDLIAIDEQKKWHENELFEIFDAVIKDAENTKINNKEYLKIFGLSQAIEIKEIWRILFSKVKRNIAEKHQESIKFLLNNGSLSTRILKSLNDDFSEGNIQKTYFKLADCLEENKFFKL
ncbi:glutamate--cysteine ligase [Salegentibacter salinarum]|uniref:Glutamate--cysteine ligase n=1 Tax=Salegentibacter salinarum TaxID=447422 RepID=A0A2N0TQT0_9FLAO|nr:glutamate-cysteine ligase family protein [Salegentibacter salinarum]PKD17089.1 glutamate--cysteine ligase [Salegentibacter salinarum]SKB54777.1 carboxylate-amine ligase [Salegentibacter salinarum]